MSYTWPARWKRGLVVVPSTVSRYLMTLHRVVSVGRERGAISKGASSRPRLIQLRTAPGRGRAGLWALELGVAMCGPGPGSFPERRQRLSGVDPGWLLIEVKSLGQGRGHDGVGVVIRRGTGGEKRSSKCREAEVAHVRAATGIARHNPGRRALPRSSNCTSCPPQWSDVVASFHARSTAWTRASPCPRCPC